MSGPSTDGAEVLAMQRPPPTAPQAGSTRARGALLRFRRSERGATATEFALIAGPFFFAMLATLEIAMIFWNSQVLETATAAASRQIYTGEFQLDSTNANLNSTQLAAAFKARLCARVTALFDCNAQVSVDVRSASSFLGASPPNPVSNKTYDTSSFGYSSIPAKAIGVVTASMEYRSFFPALAGSALSNGNRILIATSVFRTEPYSN